MVEIVSGINATPVVKPRDAQMWAALLAAWEPTKKSFPSTLVHAIHDNGWDSFIALNPARKDIPATTSAHTKDAFRLWFNADDWFHGLSDPRQTLQKVEGDAALQLRDIVNAIVIHDVISSGISWSLAVDIRKSCTQLQQLFSAPLACQPCVFTTDRTVITGGGLVGSDASRTADASGTADASTATDAANGNWLRARDEPLRKAFLEFMADTPQRQDVIAIAAQFRDFKAKYISNSRAIIDLEFQGLVDIANKKRRLRSPRDDEEPSETSSLET